MRNFEAIIVKLKHHILEQKSKKVLDKEVADALKLSQSNFATLKRRNVTPYRNILEFCEKENISCNEIFFQGS
ncbi:hypothetical protein [Sulfurimonas sp.]|uniref:hypothetical protein n=1 Tax=Sulfurimonas sp. TaxID=2022749 RepID=UPI002AB24601|nr:hypothetical protein [Sulfurimonas sp.]